MAGSVEPGGRAWNRSPLELAAALVDVNGLCRCDCRTRNDASGRMVPLVQRVDEVSQDRLRSPNMPGAGRTVGSHIGEKLVPDREDATAAEAGGRAGSHTGCGGASMQRRRRGAGSWCGFVMRVRDAGSSSSFMQRVSLGCGLVQRTTQLRERVVRGRRRVRAHEEGDAGRAYLAEGGHGDG